MTALPQEWSRSHSDCWQRPHAKIAGRYSVGSVQIEVDSIELMPFGAVTDDDVRDAGEKDIESLRERAAHAGPIADDTLVYRVEFHIVTHNWAM